MTLERGAHEEKQGNQMQAPPAEQVMGETERYIVSQAG